jgi:hypothetical protein
MQFKKETEKDTTTGLESPYFDLTASLAFRRAPMHTQQQMTVGTEREDRGSTLSFLGTQRAKQFPVPGYYLEIT